MIRIISDTLSCIPTEDAKQMGIGWLPQLIIFGDQTFRDDSEIDPPGFLSKLAAANILPKTAAPQPVLYHPLFEQVRMENPQQLSSARQQRSVEQFEVLKQLPRIFQMRISAL